jgi:hypothetical protein
MMKLSIPTNAPTSKEELIAFAKATNAEIHWLWREMRTKATAVCVRPWLNYQRALADGQKIE